MFLKRKNFNLQLHFKNFCVFLLLKKNAGKKKILGWHTWATIGRFFFHHVEKSTKIALEL